MKEYLVRQHVPIYGWMTMDRVPEEYQARAQADYIANTKGLYAAVVLMDTVYEVKPPAAPSVTQTEDPEEADGQ